MFSPSGRDMQLSGRTCPVLKGAGSQLVVSVWQHTLRAQWQQGFL